MVFLVIFHVLVIVLGPFIFGDMMGMLERAVTVLVEADSLVPMVSCKTCYALTIYEVYSWNEVPSLYDVLHKMLQLIGVLNNPNPVWTMQKGILPILEVLGLYLP